MKSQGTAAPPARIQRCTGSQRRYLPRVEATVEGLLWAAGCADEARVREALDARVRALRPVLATTPWTRDTLFRHGMSARDLGSVEDLAHAPMLDRSVLQREWRELCALDDDDEETEHLSTVQSSGSTGRPVTFVKDGFDALYMWAAVRFWCAFQRIVLPPRPRAVLLCTLPGGLEYSVRLPLLHDGALHRISTQREGAVRRIARANPSILLTDPAGLHALASIPSPPRPALLATSAQYFAPSQRAALTAALRAPIVNYYSTTETTPFAWECLEHTGRFHVLVPDYWVESVEGEIAVTRLRASLVPLLRFKTGDWGGVEREVCSCGYRGWSVVGFKGRRACMFVRGDGRELDAWQLAWLFKHYPLSDFRLTQVGAERFDVEVVEGASGRLPLRELSSRLGTALKAMGWSAPVTQVRAVASIDVVGGKPEPFVCRWARRATS